MDRVKNKQGEMQRNRVLIGSNRLMGGAGGGLFNGHGEIMEDLITLIMMMM